eukprot:scaffold2646_cov103-Isochrysis_galbana.AAC.5
MCVGLLRRWPGSRASAYERPRYGEVGGAPGRSFEGTTARAPAPAATTAATAQTCAAPAGEVSAAERRVGGGDEAAESPRDPACETALARPSHQPAGGGVSTQRVEELGHRQHARAHADQGDAVGREHHRHTARHATHPPAVSAAGVQLVAALCQPLGVDAQREGRRVHRRPEGRVNLVRRVGHVALLGPPLKGQPVNPLLHVAPRRALPLQRPRRPAVLLLLLF